MNPTALGTIYCMLSAVFYALMGVCQRELSENCDPVWVNCVQASVPTLIFGIYLTLRSSSGRPSWPPLYVAAGLMLLGAVTQLGGCSYQWSIGTVGLSISNPLKMGVMLAASAILGLIVMGERISWRGITAIILITFSIVLLGSGAEQVNEEVPTADASSSQPLETNTAQDTLNTAEKASATSPFWGILGIVAACVAGVAFASLTVGMRKTVTKDTSPEAVVFFINSMGILFLGPWAAWRLGLDGMLATTPHDLTIMFATGACNLMAFLLIAKALQLTTVVRVNVVNNAMTTAISVIAGIVIFSEPYSHQLLLGIILIMAGIVLISYNGQSKNQPATSETPEVSVQDA